MRFVHVWVCWEAAISQSPSLWSCVLQHSTHFGCGSLDNAFYFPGPPIAHVTYSVEASVVIINENYYMD